MENGYGTIRASIIVFMASACSMVLELVAGRIMAPYIGVSLYTWTSIIGVVLAGIAIGNYLGGKFGDRYGSPLFLTCIFFAGGLASLAVLPATAILNISPLPQSFHLMARSTIYTMMLFFLPTCILGMVTPIVIKLNLANLQQTGTTVGTIYAISTVGAIVGTFATGFVLISWFGTRSILWGVAIILLVIGLFASTSWKNIVKWTLTLFMFVAYIFLFLQRDSYAAPALKESNYYSISIMDGNVQGRSVKYLVLDHLIHSYVDLDDPTFHGYDYEKIFAALAAYSLSEKPQPKVMFIGGGGYAFCRYMEVTYRGAMLEVVEIDPAVTEVAYDYLALPRDTSIKTHNTDARIFLIERKTGPKYDLVVGDAFNDMSVPYHLTTYEFNELVKKNMEADGMYMVNLIDNLGSGRFAISLMHTLRKSFEHVYLYLPVTATEYSGTGTYVIAATNKAIDMNLFRTILLASGMELPAGNLTKLEELPGVIPVQKPVFLTDNHVPVDNMLAPLFNR